MNCPELRAAIARNDMSFRSIASQLSITEQALNNKMNGKTEFKNSEIKKLSQLLGLSMDAVNYIFFDNCVN